MYLPDFARAFAFGRLDGFVPKPLLTGRDPSNRRKASRLGIGIIVHTRQARKQPTYVGILLLA